MFLFESLLKIERKPNKLYLITKYTIKSLWSTSYNQKKDQLQQERKILFAENADLREKDMKYRILFFVYCLPVAAVFASVLHFFQEYVSEELANVFQMFLWFAIAFLIGSVLQILLHVFNKKGRERLYNGFSKDHGRFDMNLLHVKTMFIYQMEIIKTFAGYYAFLFIIRLVWCIILFETGLDTFINPQTTLGLDDLYLYVGGILTGLFAITICSRTMKKSVVASWEKLNTILGKLESPEPLASQFVA